MNGRRKKKKEPALSKFRPVKVNGRRMKKVVPAHDCSRCEKWFLNKQSLKRHQRLHSNSELFKCNQCESNFSSDYNLKRHIASVHDKKYFQCDKCDKFFIRQANFQRHMETHVVENDFPFECDICLQAFCHKNLLLSHMRSHADVQPLFTCDYCSESFIHRAGLNRHNLMHISEKPYKCYVCSLQFPDIASRSRHMLLHNIFCGFCKITFKSVLDLKKHIINIHKPKEVFVKNVEKIPIKALKDSKLCHQNIICLKDNNNKMVELNNEGKLNSVTTNKNAPNTEDCQTSLLLNEESNNEIDVDSENEDYSDIIENDSSKVSSTLFCCSACNKRFADINVLRKHQFMHIDKQQSCLNCKLVLNDLKTYELHAKICSPKFLCTYCFVQCLTSEEYECHSKEHNFDDILGKIKQCNIFQNSSLNSSCTNAKSSERESILANSEMIQNLLTQKLNASFQLPAAQKVNTNIESHWKKQNNFVNSSINMSQKSGFEKAPLDTNVEYYIDWLSEFVKLCKFVRQPFSIQLIQKLYQVHMAVFNVCSNHMSLLREKKTFASLMYLLKELQKLIFHYLERVCYEFLD